MRTAAGVVVMVFGVVFILVGIVLIAIDLAGILGAWGMTLVPIIDRGSWSDTLTAWVLRALIGVGFVAVGLFGVFRAPRIMVREDPSDLD